MSTQTDFVYTEDLAILQRLHNVMHSLSTHVKPLPFHIMLRGLSMILITLTLMVYVFDRQIVLLLLFILLVILHLVIGLAKTTRIGRNSDISVDSLEPDTPVDESKLLNLRKQSKHTRDNAFNHESRTQGN